MIDRRCYFQLQFDPQKRPGIEELFPSWNIGVSKELDEVNSFLQVSAAVKAAGGGKP